MRPSLFGEGKVDRSNRAGRRWHSGSRTCESHQRECQVRLGAHLRSPPGRHRRRGDRRLRCDRPTCTVRHRSSHVPVRSLGVQLYGRFSSTDSCVVQRADPVSKPRTACGWHRRGGISPSSAGLHGALRNRGYRLLSSQAGGGSRVPGGRPSAGAVEPAADTVAMAQMAREGKV